MLMQLINPSYFIQTELPSQTETDAHPEFILSKTDSVETNDDTKSEKKSLTLSGKKVSPSALSLYFFSPFFFFHALYSHSFLFF